MAPAHGWVIFNTTSFNPLDGFLEDTVYDSSLIVGMFLYQNKK